MTRIACIIIATERRRAQVSEVFASVVDQGFDDVIIVGDWLTGETLADPSWSRWGARYLCVAPFVRSPIDAQVKRDVGTVATDADVLVYLCDDHALGFGFGTALREVLDEPWDVLVPNRITYRQTYPSYVSPDGKIVSDDKGGLMRVSLNNGESDGYCGGHAGVFRREVIVAKPWSAHAHHRNWDALISAEQQARGARFCWSPRTALHIVDIELNMEPWK